MRPNRFKLALSTAASAAAIAMAAPLAAQEVAVSDVIVVTGQATTYNNTEVTPAMALQQAPITSPLSQIDNLPGVNVQEGDSFGFDDWSTTFSVRGFQTNLDTQEIGMTIDGMPNGGSNYGGGAKANRYIDTANIGGIAVNQGTADIGSLSNEALGGTIDFRTSDPEMERRVRVQVAGGSLDAQRAYLRYDTGLMGNVRAWFSASHQEATDHVNGSAENTRDHFAAKAIAELGVVTLTGYASYDDTQEDNYDQLFSLAAFETNPDSDGLTAEWVGIPYIDQVYRQAWSTLRENVLAYVKAEAELGTGINVQAAAYYHYNKGRGDWVPPYIVDVTADGLGAPNSEITGNGTVYGGSPLGQIYFTDAAGRALSPTPGCVSSITFPYGGAGAQYDPACYAPGAIGAQSYRHTHYKKERAGFTADAEWTATFDQFDNTLRAGLWFEDGKRQEYRDWHQLIDSRVGIEFEATPYWVQYSRENPQSTFKWWLQDSVSYGPLTVTAGIKQFYNDIDRIDRFGESPKATLETNSKVLFSGGVQFEAMDGLMIFGGYAENYKALGDELLERPTADLRNLEPETSENWEAGVRYSSGLFQASAVYFKSTFDNRVEFFAAGSTTGPDYLVGENGTYANVGGIDSEGLELLAAVRPLEGLSLYASYTFIDATYRGSGDDLADAALGLLPGNKVTGIPENMFVISADYTDGWFRAGVSGKHTDDRPVNVTGTFIAPSFFNADAYIGVTGEAISEVLKQVDFNLTVNNLFDEDYLGGISGGGAWIGAPRTWVLSATLDF